MRRGAQLREGNVLQSQFWQEVIPAIAANPFRNLALGLELVPPLRRLRKLLTFESLISFQSSLRSHIDPSKQKTANAFARRLRLKERKLDHAKAQSKPTVPSMDESCACLQAREPYMLSGAPIAIPVRFTLCRA
ncbi:hypothetical protein GCM10023232_15250 [Sphingosinicella ginsenosidimutans]